MSKSTFRDLLAWQRAFELCVAVYEFSECFPSSERFSLTEQIRRAAVSVPSNIAEGRGRGSWRDYRRFLLHARGSLFEVQTQALIAAKLGFTSAADAEKLVTVSEHVARLINGLLRYLNRNAPTRYSPHATR
jgi:four helix bundle protein